LITIVDLSHDAVPNMGHPSLCARFVLETLAGTVHLLACTVAHFANLVGSPLGVVLGGVGRLLLPGFLANHGVLKGNWGEFNLGAL
jgi:hypothetical protein